MENKNLLLVLVVLVPVCFGLFFYGAGLYKEDHSYKGNNDYDNIEDNKDISIDDKEIQDLISFIFVNNQNIYIGNGSDLDDYFYKNSKLDVKNIKMSDRLAIVANYINKSKITLDEMTDVYNKIFGDSIKIEPMKFSSICRSYTYDSINAVFNLDKDGICGNSDLGNYSMSLIYNIEKNEDSFSVYEYYVRVNIMDNQSIYYSDYYETKEILTSKDKTISIDSLVSDYSDKLGVYKYTFNLFDDNYIFSSVEKVK